MLDEEKIKLMTKITIYEKNEGLEDLILSKYYKEDYVQYGCLKTLVAATFCYWIIVAVYILLQFEKFLADLNHIDYFKIISSLMIGYVITLAVFYIYAFIVYNYKYSKAKPGMVQYNKWLKKLVKSYESDETKDDIRTGKVKVYSGIGGFDEELDFEDMPAEKTKAAPVAPTFDSNMQANVISELEPNANMGSNINSNVNANAGVRRNSGMGSSVSLNDELDDFLSDIPDSIPSYNQSVNQNRNMGTGNTNTNSTGRIQMPHTVNRPSQNNGFADISED